MKCPKCKKIFYDKANKEAIGNLGICLLCDSIAAEIATEQDYYWHGQENEDL